VFEWMHCFQKNIEVRRKVTIGRLEVTYSRRSSKNLWGRFGGGWQWSLGFEAGRWTRDYGFTVILNLLVASLRIHWKGDKP
jgi:hypothetical protein